MQSLAVNNCDLLTTSVSRTLADYAPNLVKLNISELRLHKAPNFLNELEHLKKLRNLKVFSIDLEYRPTVFETLINVFAENEVPIEWMRINFVNGHKKRYHSFDDIEDT